MNTWTLVRKTRILKEMGGWGLKDEYLDTGEEDTDVERDGRAGFKR